MQSHQCVAKVHQNAPNRTLHFKNFPAKHLRRLHWELCLQTPGKWKEVGEEMKQWEGREGRDREGRDKRCCPKHTQLSPAMVHCCTYGRNAFSVARPTVLNSLPNDLRESEHFMQNLKTQSPTFIHQTFYSISALEVLTLLRSTN